MKKRFLLLLFLIACAPVPEPAPEPIVEVPVIEKPIPVERPSLHPNIKNYIVNTAVQPFALVSFDAIYDNFAIIPVERYDARYQSEFDTVLVHVFKFSSREELDVVLNSEFYHVINLGASYYQGHNIALYLTMDDHRVAVWSSGKILVFIETFANFAVKDVVEAYLLKYPSDLDVSRCIDSDNGDHFRRGTVTKIAIGEDIMEWTDVCFRDLEGYVSKKGLSREDGLLEGMCSLDSRRPGYVFEYACHRGCVDGACKSV